MPLAFQKSLEEIKPGQLPPQWEGIILPGARIRRYPKRTVLFTHGDRLEHMFVVVEGWVKICTETLDGKESVVDLLSSGGLLGENAILGQLEEAYSAEVIGEDAVLLELPIRSVIEGMKANSEVSYYFLSRLIAHVQQLRTQVQQLTSAEAMERVVNFLLSLCEVEGKPFALPCEKTKLAPYLGMERETFSRILSQLKKHCGLGVDGNMITIPSKYALYESCVALSGGGSESSRLTQALN